jgi:hypothetical protein
MAEMIEAQGNAFFAKCKGAAVIITALTGLVLGVLNWFKDVRDPRVKVGYEELSKQVVGLSSDVQKLATAVRLQAEEISTIQNWIISEQHKPAPPVRPIRPGTGPGTDAARPSPEVAKIMKSVKAAKAAKPAPAPPTRKPASWEQVQTQVPKGL